MAGTTCYSFRKGENRSMRYYPRIVDQKIDKLIQAFNAVSIVGPKGCGKTRTAKERCKTVIEFQDEEKREGYLNIAETAPTLFLKKEKPILFDEWQDAPKIWGLVRKSVVVMAHAPLKRVENNAGSKSSPM